tara:strand:+ start:132 stop:374 length:243 start_codon:yes stop_codon:yes gene_type:complete
MRKLASLIIRLSISLGKFGLILYTVSLINVSIVSNDNFRDLKSGSTMLKLSGTFIQDRTNSNIKRRIKEIISNNHEEAIT